LIPIPESSRTFLPSSRSRNPISLRASGDPFSNSIPAYTSSVFSRKITTSSFPGSFTGEGTPRYQRTGRTQA
jgi:hypothetical protein